MTRDSRCRTPRSSARTPMKIAKKQSQMSQFMEGADAFSRHGLQLGVLLLDRHQVLPLDAHVERQRAGDEDRRIRSDENADYDRERETLERLATEQVQRHHHEQ